MLEISGFMSAYLRTELQRAEYVERYGEFPTNKDLNNLFFLTDLRIDGKNELLFVDQLQLSQNLYTLATYYPEYYKLGENYTLGSEKYNDMLKELKSEVKKDFFASGIKGTTHIKDAILNGAIEQAIYEIKGMPGQISTAASIKNDDWYAFTNQINELVHDISISPFKYGILNVPQIGTSFPLTHGVFTVGSIPQIVHWERNAFNRAPATWDELIKEIENGSDQEWKVQDLGGSGYHMFFEDGIYIIKVHRDSGQEAVYSLKEGILRPENSTYNYGSQTNPANSFLMGIHRDYDISPYNKWLDSEAAYEEMIKSGNAPPSEKEALAMYKEAFWNKDFMKMYNNAKGELEAAKKYSLSPDKNNSNESE